METHHIVMKYTYLLLAILLGTPIYAETDTVVGRVGDIEVTTSDIKQSLAELAAANGASPATDAAALGQYARSILLQKLILKQAKDGKWDEQPEVISKLVRARELAIVESWIAAKSTPPKDYPSDAEVRDAYEANKGKLVVPKSYLMAQIYIGVAESASDEATATAKAKLDKVLASLSKAKADFAEIAKTFSEEGSSASKGGEIGWLTEAQIQPEIRKQLPELSRGTVSAPLRLKDGWHIIKILDLKESRTATFDEVRDNLVTRLRSEQSLTMRKMLMMELIKAHPLAINEIELTKMLTSP